MQQFLQVLREMDRRILIGIGIAGVVMIYLLWGFWLEFIGLTLLCLIIAVGIIHAIARYYDADSQKYLGDNNTWFFVGVGMCAITFVIALFHFGPAVLLPENTPTNEQRGVMSNLFNHILYGKGAPAKSIPTDPLPWATGTWFWWKAWFLYCLLTFAYFWFAFWDEAMAGVRKITQIIQERHAEALKERQDKHDLATAQIKAQNAAGKGKSGFVPAPVPPAPPTRLTFWEFARWDLIMELGGTLLKLFFRNRTA